MKKHSKKKSAVAAPKVMKHGRIGHKEEHVDKEPEYMIQINDPKMVRKDLLESLREVIIFMQGYEKFRRIQEEKVAIFAALRADIKGLNLLIEHQLRKYLPQGKLRVISPFPTEESGAGSAEEEESKVEIVSEEEPSAKKQKVREERKAPANELEELEVQLREIESQLRNVK